MCQHIYRKSTGLFHSIGVAVQNFGFTMLFSGFDLTGSDNYNGVSSASMFFLNETVNYWRKWKDIALGLITMIRIYSIVCQNDLENR